MANSLNTLNTSSTNVTTSAYVTLVASTSVNFNNILVTDTTGKLLKLAVGNAGFEVDLFQLPVSGTGIIPLPSQQSVPLGSRLSLKAIDSNATSGFVAATLLS